MDLNGDGKIGGPGLQSQLEQATHIDFNRDGAIGYRPPANGGKHRVVHFSSTLLLPSFSRCFFQKGLVGKIEQATHIDLNGDGIIGGRPGQYRPH